MSSEDTVQHRATDSDLRVLQDDNARLRAQLGRLVRDLEERTDVAIRVHLDASPGEDMVLVARSEPESEAAPAHPGPPVFPPRTTVALGPDGHDEVQRVAERLSVIQRDLLRIQQDVEKLLWRVGAAPAESATD